MRNRLKLALALLFWTNHGWSGNSKVSVAAGFFAINAKSGNESSSVSSPSALHVGYQREVGKKMEFKIGYSILMADFTGSDLGYGVDAGLNYYPVSGVSDQTYRDERVLVVSRELWRPYVGVAFNQRNFQSVRNSYAGMGLAFGSERYHDEKINFKGEIKYTSLGGSSESQATEIQALVGIVFKL
jgi:hypothetical protein